MTRAVSRIFRFTALFISFLLFLVGYILITLPDVDTIKGCMKTVMFEVDLCPKKDGYVTLGQISPHVKNAILVSEDSAFYQHDGFDLAEIQASIEKNIKQGGYHRGGSTITQQLAKNAFLTFEKTPLRKIREALITVQLEKKLKKNEIFEKYLNIVEFGPKLYGVNAAARYYFKKHPRDLTSLEGAFLAFLLPSPKKHSASFQKKTLTKFAYSSLSKILGRMARFGRISYGEYEWARSHLGSFPWYGLGSYSSEEIPDGPILNIPVDAIEPETPAEPSKLEAPVIEEESEIEEGEEN